MGKRKGETENKKIDMKNIGLYLYIACYNNEIKKQEAFIVVTKAMLSEEIAIELENLGDHAIIFTSEKNFGEINQALKGNQIKYLLIDLSLVYDLEAISGFFPDSQIDLIRKITENNFTKEKPYLKQKLEESIAQENFELSAPLRDLTKNTNE